MGKSNGGTRASSAGSPKGLTANEAFRMLENGGNGRDILNQIRRERNDPEIDWAELSAERTDRQPVSQTVSEFDRERADTAYNEISNSLSRPRGTSDSDWNDTLSALREEVNDFVRSGFSPRQWEDHPNAGTFVGTAYEHFSPNVAERLQTQFMRELRKRF